MLELLSLKPEAFGLDISDLSLKIVKLKRKGKKIELASFGETEIPPGIIKKGEIRKEEELIKILKEALKKVRGEKIKTRYTIVSLPEEKAFLQVIKMPPLSEEELKSAILYEAENYIPLPLEKVYLDFQVVSSSKHLKHLEVLIAALPKEIVDSYTRCLKEAGLKPLALEVESLAVARALIKNEITQRSVLLIDFGATRTGFIIFLGRSIRFTTSITVSSEDFTNIIAKTLKISQREAENLKRRFGLEGRIVLKIKDGVKKKIEKGKVFEALIPALTDLIQQIKKYIDFYQTHTSKEYLPPDSLLIEKALLCGGGANLKGFPELLSLELKIPVELGNPWVNILSDPKEGLAKLPLEKSLAYATALGLALRGIQGK